MHLKLSNCSQNLNVGNDHKQHGCAPTHEQLGYLVTWGQQSHRAIGGTPLPMPLPTEVGRWEVSATALAVTLATPVWCHKRGHKTCPLPGQLPSPGTQPLHCTLTAMPSPSQGFPKPYPLRGATVQSTFSTIKLRITCTRRELGSQVCYISHLRVVSSDMAWGGGFLPSCRGDKCQRLPVYDLCRWPRLSEG